MPREKGRKSNLYYRLVISPNRTKGKKREENRRGRGNFLFVAEKGRSATAAKKRERPGTSLFCEVRRTATLLSVLTRRERKNRTWVSLTFHEKRGKREGKMIMKSGGGKKGCPS